MNRLEVVYAGWDERWPLGTLAAARGQVWFEFSAEARAQGLELSPLQLPLSRPGVVAGEPFFHGLPGLIADALPDGWGLLLMDRAFRHAGRDPRTVGVLERLAVVGERAMGALSFRPPAGGAPDAGEVALLETAQAAARVLAQREAPEALRQLLLLGGSPQGARPKVLLDYDTVTGRASTGLGLGEPWIFKFPAADEHREVCAIEALYMRVAAAAGIEVPASVFVALDARHAAFGARRFDREGATRVPTHTLSGLLHADFRLPSVDAETFLRATRALTGDEREVSAAFARCVFNVAMHNRDDHSRNFAYRLGRDRRWRLSPAYDLGFAAGPGGEHSMAFAGEARAPARDHLLRAARGGGLPPRTAALVLEQVLEATSKWSTHVGALPIRRATLATMKKTLGADLPGVVPRFTS